MTTHTYQHTLLARAVSQLATVSCQPTPKQCNIRHRRHAGVIDRTLWRFCASAVDLRCNVSMMLRSLKQEQQQNWLSKPSSQHIVIASLFLTVIVTLYSLNELQGILHTQSTGNPATLLQRQRAAQTAAATYVAAGQQVPGQQSAATPAVAADPESPEPTYPEPAAECHAMEHTEYWGDVVEWGSSFHTSTPGQCCEACQKHNQKAGGKLCNVWVWCGVKALCGSQYRECWLKHLDKPRKKRPVSEGSDVGWWSGLVGPDAEEEEEEKPTAADKKVRKYHVVTSAQGSAVHWQARVHYYWYLKRKAECEQQLGAACEMGGFTRLLHSGQPDDLMDEIPTFVAEPLPNSVVKHDSYPVLNRPYAFLQWIKAVNITEDYILMSEPDHIFLRPIPNLMRKDTWPAAYPFFYIEPAKDDNIPIVAQFMPDKTLSQEEAEKIAQMGNSPTFVSMADMHKLTPLWYDLSIKIYKNDASNKKWGWVQEMYAFAIAAYMAGVRHVDLVLHLMAQPPWDANMELSANKPFYILHYTYGQDFTLDGKMIAGKYGAWHFDKRTYMHRPPPRHLGDPPAAMKNDMVRALVNSINEASQNIPCWDEYFRTGKRSPTCDEVIPGSIYPKPPRSTASVGAHPAAIPATTGAKRAVLGLGSGLTPAGVDPAAHPAGTPSLQGRQS